LKHLQIAVKAGYILHMCPLGDSRSLGSRTDVVRRHQVKRVIQGSVTGTAAGSYRWRAPCFGWLATLLLSGRWQSRPVRIRAAR